MKRVLFAVILVGSMGSEGAQASFVFGSQPNFSLDINLSSSAPNPNGSLSHNGLEIDSPLVGTNLVAPSASAVISTPPSPLFNTYLDFTTGAYNGTDAQGDTLYKAGGNFFLLGGLLPTAAGSAPLAFDASTGASVVSSMGGGIFELTMSISNGYISPTLASQFGVNSGYGYEATLTFDYVVNPSMAGNQLLGGSIQFLGQATPAAVPEPASAALVAIGIVGIASVGSYRLRKSKLA